MFDSLLDSLKFKLKPHLRVWLSAAMLLIFILISRFWRLSFPPQFVFDEVYHVPAAYLISQNQPAAYEWWHDPFLSEFGDFFRLESSTISKAGSNFNFASENLNFASENLDFASEAVPNFEEVDPSWKKYFPAHARDSYFDWLHPPLAKLIMAASIKILGLQPLAWRLPSALAGLGVIGLTYLLAVQIGLLANLSQETVKKWGLVAASLVSLDGLVLVQSRIGMNDILAAGWMLASSIFFVRCLRFSGLKLKRRQIDTQISQIRVKRSKFNWRKNLVLTGVMLGLGLATKWSVFFSWVAIFGVVAVVLVRTKFYRRLPWLLFSVGILPLLIYVASYSQMFLQGKSFGHFAQLHQRILWYQTHRDQDHVYASSALSWPLGLRPVWYWTSRQLLQSELTGQFQLSVFPDQSEIGQDRPVSFNQTANIYAGPNLVLYWLGLISVLWLGFSLVASHASTQKQLNLFASFNSQSSYSRLRPTVIPRKRLLKLAASIMLLFYIVQWLPWIASPRIMFFYHYLLAVPWLAIILGWWLLFVVKPKNSKLFYLLLTLVLINFLLFYPHWTGLPVFNFWADKVYFAIPSWR